MSPKLVDVSTRTTVEGIGCCIYCGGTSGKRTIEHIVPESIGGKFAFKDAVCGNCKKATDRFETSLLLGPFYAQRIIYGFRSKKHGRKKRAILLRNRLHNGAKVGIALRDFPQRIVGFGYGGIPSFFNQKYGNPPFRAGPILYTLESSRLFDLKTNLLVLRGFAYDDIHPQVDVNHFSRFLCKIAHAYACAVIDRSKFKAYLPKYILGTTPYHAAPLIGNSDESPTGHSSFHHQTSLAIVNHPKGQLVVVGIWLFSKHTLQPLQVIVGRLKEQVDDIETLRRYPRR